ncbi:MULTISPECIES: GNAT family N-acetyltransferase [unclassified Paenibacillus]|uniref:GNAT family N-acetyltransferase n=1 Tax=unclassified Paenibacillus TaxID=185978 RepID=UPI00104DB28A|nr:MULTISPECIES: GNAT family N-acetyltransferase [unclassified Paenibacillus]NIK70971.1 phosphinothricin acetyltransferase [Paenibacillus sp. BK720]TCM85308.1 phosphinothricin acetyltransferase [Paenibacillus sp. BK033]
MQLLEISEQHLSKVHFIYNYYVTHTTVSFHTEELTLDQIRNNVMNGNNRYKTYVIEEQDSVIGYALLTQHKNKQAYDVTAEVTIYIDPNHLGNGIGSKAISFLELKAKELGFHVLVATICTENERSIRLFERLGYEKCAHFKEVGYKFNRRLDIASYQKIIG